MSSSDKKYKYTSREADKIGKHGINLTIFNEGINSANVVAVDVKEGHFQEFQDKKSTYIYYIFECEGVFVINDEKINVGAGDLVVLPPMTRIYYFGKLEMSLTVTPCFQPDNEIHVRFIDKKESPFYQKGQSDYLLLLHGINGKAGSYWQSWLADQVSSEGYQVIMPSLPNPSKPDWYEWVEAIKQNMKNIKKIHKLTIVGHSLGVAAGLDCLETLDDQEKVKKFISVAGFYKPYGLELNEAYMRQKEIDIKRLRNKVGEKYVVRSLNDPYVKQSALQELADDLEANDIIIRDGQHFQHENYEKKFELVKSLVLM